MCRNCTRPDGKSPWRCRDSDRNCTKCGRRKGDIVLQEKAGPFKQGKAKAAARPEGPKHGLERKVDGLANNLAKVVEQLGSLHAGSFPPGSGAKPPARAAAAAAGAEPGPPKDDTYKEA